ncbi:Uncharacterized protein SCF082_LOCUS36410 [Durusdinium trenchii]|uniref:Uncharacterized protein n=1 Tax=Durusdinium trenchii TaxID=1381693 RepID=A0ABP0PFU1_9DINO
MRQRGRKRWCADCHSLEAQLSRNVGSLDLEEEELKGFFAQGKALKAAAPNSRLSWKTVRACLKESMIRQRTHRIVRESSSEGRPLEYWTRLGYAEDEVRKCPQEVDAVMGTTLYKVTVRSTSTQQIDEEVEQTILDKEKNCARQRKKGKGEEPEGEAAWDEAQKAKREKSNAKASALAGKALSLLTPKVQSIRAALKDAEKKGGAEPETLSALQEAAMKYEGWLREARSTVAAVSACAHAQLPELPFAKDSLTASLAAASSAVKKCRSDVRQAADAAAETAETVAEPKAKRRRRKQAEGK